MYRIICTQQSTDRYYFTIGSLRVVNIILLNYVISKYIPKLTFVYQIIHIKWIVIEYSVGNNAILQKSTFQETQKCI